MYSTVSCTLIVYALFIQLISTQQSFPIAPFLNTNISPIRKIDDIFIRLPSLQELDQLVLRADSVSILKTIQVIASNRELICPFKLAYLFEIEGRMKSAIFKKKLMADRLETVIDVAEDQIERLQLQNQRLQTDNRLLFLDQKQFTVRRKIQQLEKLYQRYNALLAQIEPRQQQIKKEEERGKELEKLLEQDREKLTKIKIQLSQIDSRINAFRKIPDVLRQSKANLEEQESILEDQISNNNYLLLSINRNILNLERSLEGLNKDLDVTQAKFLKVQVDLQRQRDAIIKGEEKEDQAIERISLNNDKINQQEKKLEYSELRDLRSMVQSLKNRLPGLQSQIDRQYYLCYTNNSIAQQIENQVVVYLMNGSQFTVYLQNVYNYRISSSYSEQLELYPLDIFSERWTNQFGAPFGIQQSLLQDPDSELTIVSDFYCLAPTETVSGFGVIETVNSRTIVIEDSSNQKLLLILGSCTRLECSACLDQTVEIGKLIVWRGLRHPDVKHYIQLYTGTII